LEIAWTRVVSEGRTISGNVLMPFFTEGVEGFDVNTPDDWLLAERHVERGDAQLPVVPQVPYPTA
jgi:N-acylneuraminate cytidylyltransferase